VKSAPDKIRETVEQKRVKLHVFEPSNRSIWTVVGSGQEYWVEPDLGFCSCAGFYFSRLSGREGCYHLESLRAAIAEKQFEAIRFADGEYGDFVTSLISDLQSPPTTK